VKVGVTSDIRGADGRPVYDLALLDGAADVNWEWMRGEGVLQPGDLAGYDAIVLFHPQIRAKSLHGVERLRLVARLGVGFDNIDIPSCTAAGVLVTVTPDAVRRPMASGAMAFLLALAHRLPERDRHVRAGGWDRFAHVGTGLQGRTLGLIGLGNIGREIVSLAAPFGMRVIATDPFLATSPAGVESVSLEDLLAQSDFVIVTCPLNDDTFHLLDDARLRLMKSTAYLVNVARGPIVDGRALADALESGRLAGAALDVFESEPALADDPLLTLDNTILAPHAIGLSDELFRLGGASVARAVLDVSQGRMPRYPVNPEAAPDLTLGAAEVAAASPSEP
jgi:phosphoglycerate dehydrogenase-like enzyme